MKKTILPALAMLIISAVMLSTASYAWFAMSRDVTATDMQVSIKSDSSYLLISDREFTQAANASTSVALNTSAQLLPVTFDDNVDLDIDDFAVDGDGTIWYHMKADNSGNSAATVDTTKYSVEDGKLGEYVYSERVYIAVSEQSNPLGALKVSDIKFATGNDLAQNNAINVVVVSSYGNQSKYERFCVTNVGTKLTQKWGENAGTVELVDSVPSCATGNVVVDIYIFFNGDHSSIYTDNLPALSGNNSITVKFTAAPAAPAN